MTPRGYSRPPAAGQGLRLHLNEHTGGCSTDVVEALSRLSPEEIARYPEYADTTARVAAHLGVGPERVLLTNGLDEGILVAALAWLGGCTGPKAVVIVEPAFELYDLYADALGARIDRVPPREDFSFPEEQVLAAISPVTRLVFLTSPNNPTGQLIPRSAIRAVLDRVPRGALVFLDEAYSDFAGESFLDEAAAYPQLVIGRTFAKAYGLAGLRLGALVGAPETLAPLRRVIPPYSVNVGALAAVEAAIADPDHRRRYLAESAASKRLLYAACRRWGAEYWPSAANFVLIRIGPRVREIVAALAARGIYIRDRSDAPGCEGCVRITAGRLDETRRVIAALEELLCGAP